MKAAVYPLLEANLEKLDEQLIPVLQTWSAEKFSNTEERAQVARSIRYFSDLIDEFPQGDKASQTEIAIVGYQIAGTVLTRQDFPTDWARIQGTLGAAYAIRQQGDDLEQAIQCYQHALQVLTRQDFPTDWARIQDTLGLAYANRHQGDDLEQAIQYFQHALQVRTRQDFPLEYIETKYNLGLVYQRLFKDWQVASTCFAEAIDTLEARLRQTPSAGARRYLAEQWEMLYNRMIDLCLIREDGQQWFKALEYVERSKACNLPQVTPTGTPDQSSVFRVSHLLSLLNGLDEQTAVVEWFINTSVLSLQIFIMRKGWFPYIIQTQEGEVTDLITLGNCYLRTYQKLPKASATPAKWQTKRSLYFNRFARLLHLDDIVADLQQTSKCTRLILVPHCFMHLFPLHVLPLKQGQTRLDEFDTVQYAPSLHLLHHLSTRARPEFNRLVAIENPNQDLSFTEVEVTALRTHFKEDTVYRHQATRKNQIDFQDLNQIHCLHWAGHGYFDLDQPNHSGLVLADAFLTTPIDPARHRLTPRGNYLDMTKCLTLPDIFTLPLQQCRLVTLSACETGWSDPKSSTDEYIGLPSAFLYAGATNIVNSLWQVNDLSTAWLMIKFYQNYRQDSTSVPQALNVAQKWLRGLTKQALREWLTASQITLTRNQRAELEDNLNWYEDAEKPYQGVYYWGGFCAVGR